MNQKRKPKPFHQKLGARKVEIMNMESQERREFWGLKKQAVEEFQLLGKEKKKIK